MHRLRGAEIKVFLYISRRTLGFKKRVDAIGMDQLMNGIRTRKGRRLDHGTGLSESGVKKAVRALIDKGLIRRVRQKDPQRPSQDIQSLYALRFRDKEGGHKGAPGGGTGVPRVGTQEKPTGGHHRVPTIDSSRNSSTDSSPSSSPDGDGTSPKPTDDWVADFETFWSFYPRDRGSKDEARRAYRSKLRDDPQGRQEALEGLRRSLMSKQWVDSWCDRESPGHYIPHAATFIRNRRWDLQPAPHPKVYSVQAALDLYDVPKGRGASAKQTVQPPPMEPVFAPEDRSLLESARESEEIQSNFEAALEMLRRQFGPIAHGNWLLPLKPALTEGGLLLLVAPNVAAKEWIDMNYRQALLEQTRHWAQAGLQIIAPEWREKEAA